MTLRQKAKTFLGNLIFEKEVKEKKRKVVVPFAVRKEWKAFQESRAALEVAEEVFPEADTPGEKEQAREVLTQARADFKNDKADFEAALRKHESSSKAPKPSMRKMARPKPKPKPRTKKMIRTKIGKTIVRSRRNLRQGKRMK